MLNSILDNFMNLDESNKKKIINLVSNVISPIKLYLIVVIFLLLVMCISNYYICRKFMNLNLQNN
jgi:hypothetical protein